MHNLPELPYEYNSLEPYIDEQTMKIHHDKHHQAYVDKLNKALENSNLKEKSIQELMSNLNSIPEEIRQAVMNHGGGHINHTFFWEILAKEKPFSEDLEIGSAIIGKFGSFESFKEQFSNSASTLFGSGWAWLVLDNETKQLEIIQTKNQGSPVSENKTPLIGIDVWEHAYYLKYQNKRPEYIEAFFNIINWEKVEEIYMKSLR